MKITKKRVKLEGLIGILDQYELVYIFNNGNLVLSSDRVFALCRPVGKQYFEPISRIVGKKDYAYFESILTERYCATPPRLVLSSSWDIDYNTMRYYEITDA